MNAELTITDKTVYQLGKRPHKVYEAAIGLMLYAVEKTPAAAKAAAIQQAFNVAANMHQFRAYRSQNTTYIVRPNANGGFTVEILHDESIVNGRDSSGPCWVDSDSTFAEMCKRVEKHIEDQENPIASIECPRCHYPTFAANRVDPLPDHCANPVCGQSFIEALAA